jgi:hypothetical protein
MLHPTAPAVAASAKLNRPVEARWPAKGMMPSDGTGMQADYTATSPATPAYPKAEITAMIHVATDRSRLSSKIGLR